MPSGVSGWRELLGGVSSPLRKIVPLVFLAFALPACRGPDKIRVTARDEAGAPLEGAAVMVVFLGYSGERTERVSGVTDRHGVFLADGRAELRVNVRVVKDGFYETMIDRLRREENHEVNVRLRKVGNPIPLHARKAVLFFPVNGEWIGYDFEVGDWVAPHGEGRHVDASFRCETRQTGPRDGEGSLAIRFGELEGILVEEDGYLLKSEMKMPHLAPLEGYHREFSRSENSYHNENARRGIGYFFRTRAIVEEGKLVRANYGKIAEDFRFIPVESGWHVADRGRPKSFATLYLTYYFNPRENDRNLEFATRRNLFENLDRGEQVRRP